MKSLLPMATAYKELWSKAVAAGRPSMRVSWSTDCWKIAICWLNESRSICTSKSSIDCFHQHFTFIFPEQSIIDHSMFKSFAINNNSVVRRPTICMLAAQTSVPQIALIGLQSILLLAWNIFIAFRLIQVSVTNVPEFEYVYLS